MSKVFIHTNGCAVLRHETERIAKFFRENNWQQTDVTGEADIVVMTCCGVTQNEEDQAIGIIRELDGQRAPQSLFIVGGCLPAFAQERILEAAPQARLMTYDQLDELDDIIKATTPMADVSFNTGPLVDKDEAAGEPDNDDYHLAARIDKVFGSDNCVRQYEYSTLYRYMWQDARAFQIKVAYGCPGNCSYCATKLAIGRFRSVSKASVLRQFREGVEQGYTYFVLMGDEIGSYGQDFGEDLIMLLDEFYRLAPQVNIAIRYIHPDVLVRLYPRLKQYFANGYVNYFCCATQSFSPDILRAMNRNPHMEAFLECMDDMNRQQYPVNKHTQVVVGFPGETERDFLMTLQALVRCDFDHININLYSPRRGTAAYQLTDSVPQALKEERGLLLRQLLNNRKKAKLYEAIKLAALN